MSPVAVTYRLAGSCVTQDSSLSVVTGCCPEYRGHYPGPRSPRYSGNWKRFPETVPSPLSGFEFRNV